MSNTAEEFFKKEVFLVVEPSKTFLATIQSCLHSLGVKSDRISVVSKYEDACRVMQETKPKFLISEYDINGKNGIGLVELHQKLMEDTLRISMIISQNSSDSVIAEAAEEQVDGFLLKPFSPEIFQKKVISIIEAKLQPSPYVSKIHEGQKFMKAGLLDEAISAFDEAQKLHPRPSLACFYMGETYRVRKDINRALQDFRAGRAFQPMHYKCLLGEFEVLIEKQQYVEANELIPVLMKNFPLTPKRMMQIFIAAVFSKHFDYLLLCHEQYLKLEKKPSDLTNIASMAMYTGAKWYLQQKDGMQAQKLFECALYTTGRDIHFLEKIVVELVKQNAGREAQFIFQKANPADVGTDAYNRIAFDVDRLTLPKEYLFEKARKYYQLGIASKEQYIYIIKYFVEQKKDILAESVAAKAIPQYPEIKDEANKILKQLTKPA